MDFFKKNTAPQQDENLEQQVERGNLFTHTALSKHSARINEIESFLYAVIDVLISKGIVPPEELTQTVKKVREEMLSNQEASYPGISLRVDNSNSEDFIPVNCEERLHICKAVCCKLDFALNAEEVESGKIKWDLGRPYFIRHHTKTCYCTHNDPVTLRCNIYHQRPSVCKKYSCANDTRIWANFERMELNKEWIDENIKQRKLKFTGALMFTDQDTISYNPAD
jgi:Fe-S-cluster containining protein